MEKFKNNHDALLRLIYDYGPFEDVQELVNIIYINLKLHGQFYMREEEFTALSSSGADGHGQVGWPLLTLMEKRYVKGGSFDEPSIELTEKGRKYVEENVSDITFKKFLADLSSVGSELLPQIAVYLFNMDRFDDTRKLKAELECCGIKERELEKIQEFIKSQTKSCKNMEEYKCVIVWG